jgi:ABC-type antimicrobial peptide transport system permease subunit
VTLHTAQSQVGYPGLVSCYIVQAKDSRNLQRVKEDIRTELPGVEAYDKAEFLRNNIREMESGFLPLLYVIAAIGSVVLTTILSLLLSINILEGRKDFAVMKTLGSPQGFLPRLILHQSLLISFAGCAVAILLFFPMVALVERFSPEVGTQSSLAQIALVLTAVTLISLLSSVIAIRRIRTIYPLEAFA